MSDKFCDWVRMEVLKDEESLAWDLYCQETAGTLHAYDFWCEVPERVKLHYIDKVKEKQQ